MGSMHSYGSGKVAGEFWEWQGGRGIMAVSIMVSCVRGRVGGELEQ